MEIKGISSTSATQLQASQASSSGNASSTSTSVTDLANAMNELQKLQQSAPAKFKEVAASIADTLKSDASRSTGHEAQRVSRLAEEFEQAAKTGSMSPLERSGAASENERLRASHSAVQSYGTQQSSSGAAATESPADVAQVIRNALQQVGP